MRHPLFSIQPEGMNIFTLRLLLAATLPITDPHHVCNEDCTCKRNVNSRRTRNNSTVSL
jgi:hypothetical protein